MSMITEQVKELDECAKKCQQYPFINVRMNNEGHDFRFIFRNAADTIKTLSEKVRAANMERSTAYYNGGWIPVSERLPEIEEKDCHGNITFSKTVLTSQKYGNGFIYIGNDQYTTNNGGGWLSEVPFDDPDECCEVIAWMPLPEPYREDGETE